MITVFGRHASGAGARRAPSRPLLAVPRPSCGATGRAA